MSGYFDSIQLIYNISIDAQHVCRGILSLDIAEFVELWGLADDIILANKFGYNVANLLEEITKHGITSIEHPVVGGP